jgi:hypothetical protein
LFVLGAFLPSSIVSQDKIALFSTVQRLDVSRLHYRSRARAETPTLPVGGVGNGSLRSKARYAGVVSPDGVPPRRARSVCGGELPARRALESPSPIPGAEPTAPSPEAGGELSLLRKKAARLAAQLAAEEKGRAAAQQRVVELSERLVARDQVLLTARPSIICFICVFTFISCGSRKLLDVYLPFRTRVRRASGALPRQSSPRVGD